jgi:peroxiredoxin
MIEAGRPAPDFTLRDQDGNEVSLSDYRGRTVVLAFYPSDFSPVCTDQLSIYQERLAELEGEGVELLGISVDSAWTHKAFRRQLGVTMPLLADFHPKGEVAKAYGVWVDDYGVSARALVMVGPDGQVVWSHRSSSPLEIPSVELIFDSLPLSGRGVT